MIEENPNLVIEEDSKLKAPEGIRLIKSCPSHFTLDLGESHHAFSGTALEATGMALPLPQNNSYTLCNQREVIFKDLASCKKYDLKVSTFELSKNNQSSQWSLTKSPVS